MKVRNMESNNGTTVPNQFIIETKNFFYFQSYNTIIAKENRKTHELTLDRDKWDYSRTTAKYRNIFTGLTTKETEAKIKDKTIKLANLN